MSAQIFILPVVARPSFQDPAWREQFDREVEARMGMLHQAPPRTRPLIACQREQER
jgi:hypothetical protein